MRCKPIFPVLAVIAMSANFAAAADLGVEAIKVAPESPGASAICTMKVHIKNSGTKPASYLMFNVRIDGQEVPLYKLQTYIVDIAPGTGGDVDLYNFYSPSAPKAFTVEVKLVEAQWVQVKKEGTSSTTTPTGSVEGLPAGSTLTVKMAGRTS